ncbi:MAG: type II secretion system secretin GspD [Pseudoxanthomonas suwonensis]|nr:type II secretion system secretin GspD [Pseudoxanthomonas suwonensis]
MTVPPFHRNAALVAFLAALLAACASIPPPDMRREARHPAYPHVPAADASLATVPGSAAGTVGVQQEPLPATTGARAQVRRGTGEVINLGAATAPPPGIGASSGQVRFNFEGESLHVVVDAILGHMLGQNYMIAPGVQGSVTLSTPKAVGPAEALSLLEMVLGWNNARLLYADGRYNIVPADTALASGAVAPGVGAPSSTRGLQARTVPLRYISAAEMEKLLKPYARPDSIVNVDSGRNLITVTGTAAEIRNYLRTIEVFDVDWMASMSVGVFPLASGRATQVVADLEKVFGQDSKSPVAGMFRFMPLDGANAVLVITPQARYLDEIEQWIDRIDSVGGVRLYTHELKYITARDLAMRLAEVFGSSSAGAGEGGEASIMPGLQSTTIDGGGMDARAGLAAATLTGEDGSALAGGGGFGSGNLNLGERQGGNAAVTLEVGGDRVGVSAVDETNSLLVRSSPQAWQSIREVIERLDVMPLQVHIEAQVVEVLLSGDLSYGVSWFFGADMEQAGIPRGPGRLRSVGGRILPLPITVPGGENGTTIGAGAAWSLLGRSAAGVISALDAVSDVQILQSPSVMVRNNHDATFNVGSRIPIYSVNVNPGYDNARTYSQVQYLDTGTILKVRPRVTREGTVFLDIVQEVSSPVGSPDPHGNVRVDTRHLKTNAVLQSGDTVMLAGLIRDGTTRGSSGLPGLSRLPVIGGLFGRQTSNKERSEVIVLLTPTLVRDPSEARDLTDEYGRRFRALEPLNRAPSGR